MLLEIITETIHDTWLMFPLLLITYCILEVFERRQSAASDEKIFFALQKVGPIIGALVGLIPQCGFSVLAAMLFLQKNITLGTLLAVMIATSDEAVPILLSQPSLYHTLASMLIAKFLLGLIVGYIVDFLLRHRQEIIRFEDMEDEEEEDVEDLSEEESAARGGCSCCYPDLPLPISAFYRTVRIFLFLFITSFILTGAIAILGEDTLKSLFLQDTFLQPILAAIIGFIPNCAATVILAELFSIQSISFGSFFAGLVTNSGLALLVLIRYSENRRLLIYILSILLVSAIIPGILLQVLM